MSNKTIYYCDHCDKPIGDNYCAVRGAVAMEGWISLYNGEYGTTSYRSGFLFGNLHFCGLQCLVNELYKRLKGDQCSP